MKRAVFIGYDSREPVAYDVAKHSIVKRTNGNVTVHPLKLSTMRELGIYTRPDDKLGSTEFTFSRFWVPYLMGYEGVGIFIDCDFVVNCDIMEMFDAAEKQFENPDIAVALCKHDYIPREGAKMDGQTQHLYPRKNWTSSMVFRNDHPLNRRLTLPVLNDEKNNGKFFHRLQWLSDSTNDDQNLLESEEHIGAIPLDFNWLSGEYYPPQHLKAGYSEPRIIHWTLGGGWFFSDLCWSYPFTEIWLNEVKEVIGRDWTKEDCVDAPK